jgi:Family of unknown function (DUF5675)/Phage tail lysozyme
MRLKLERNVFTDESTIGKLFVDGRFECFTLEDKVRPVKIPKITAIPTGTYGVHLTFSPRFQRVVPAIEQVPNFLGIRIHAGNTAGHTEGCVLVGQRAGSNIIHDSRPAYRQLFDKLRDGTEAGQVLIEIVDARGGAIATDPAPTGDPISDAALAKECRRQIGRFEVAATYLAAVAKYRSNVRNDRNGTGIGPYRFTEREWEDYCEDPELGDDVDADITNWRSQVAVFALRAQRALDDLREKLATSPTPVQIHLAQVIGSAAAAAAIKNPETRLDAILASTAEADLPISATAAEILARYAPLLQANGGAVTGKAALDRILDALTPAYQAMQALVVRPGDPPDPPKPVRGDDLFRVKVPPIMTKLMGDFGLDKVQAAAILGNIGHECAGFKLMQEQKPRGGRGGWGWCQWTGSRRVAFEAFSDKQGLPRDADAAYYGFLKLELESTHKSTIVALKKTGALREAVIAFERNFERAASDAKHYDRRERYARIALAAVG